MGLLKERWEWVNGYEGRYKVSDHGRVMSVARFRIGKSNSLVPVPEKVMSIWIKKKSSNGRTLPYAEIRLRGGGPRQEPCKSFLVHRLVAQAFIGELYDGAQVDHIDGEHKNNHFSNLRILSAKEHGLLHPCVINKDRQLAMQAAAKSRVMYLRQNGYIVGRNRVISNCK